MARSAPVRGDAGGRTVIVTIDPGSIIPPYEQLRAQITELVAAGTLASGARLPSVRQLAGDLGVAPGTVARAYRELEHQGVLRARGRHGSFVTEKPLQLTEHERTSQLVRAATTFAATARRLGLSKRDALARVREALDAQ